MEELLQLIGNFGFPIVVSIYLLVRLETRVEALSCSITELSGVILRLKESIASD